MQLSALAQRWRALRAARLSPFTRTLLALGICTAPVIGGVLPEDRADVMWHYYNGGDITVEGPSVLIRKKVGDNLSFTVNYYEDMISSASIDVKLSASPYHEKRTQWSGGLDYLHGKTMYSAGAITSKEPDYKANTIYFSLSQDMFGDLTTLSLGYRRGWDQIYRDRSHLSQSHLSRTRRSFGCLCRRNGAATSHLPAARRGPQSMARRACVVHRPSSAARQDAGCRRTRDHR